MFVLNCNLEDSIPEDAYTPEELEYEIKRVLKEELHLKLSDFKLKPKTATAPAQPVILYDATY